MSANENKLSPDDPRLTAYALGELEGSELAEVEAALRADPAAQAVVAQIRVAADQLRAGLAEETVEAAAGEGSRVQPGFGDPRANLRLRFLLWSVSLGSLAAAACLTVLLVRENLRHRARESKDAVAISTPYAAAAAKAPAKAAMEDKFGAGGAPAGPANASDYLSLVPSSGKLADGPALFAAKSAEAKSIGGFAPDAADNYNVRTAMPAPEYSPASRLGVATLVTGYSMSEAASYDRFAVARPMAAGPAITLATAARVHPYIQDNGILFSAGRREMQLDPGFVFQAGRFGEFVDRDFEILAVPVPNLDAVRPSNTLAFGSVEGARPDISVLAGSSSMDLFFETQAASKDALILSPAGEDTSFESLAKAWDAGRQTDFSDIKLPLQEPTPSP
jgi:hypothetical protein